jgi:hypothetical protein
LSGRLSKGDNVAEATKIIRDLQEQARAAGGDLEKVEVSQDMYDALVAECRPASPRDFLGVEILILPGGDGVNTLH